MRGGNDIIRKDRIGRIERFLPEHVEAGAGDPLVFERGQKGVVVQDRTACDIDDERAGLHAGELGGADQAARLVVQRGRDNDKIGLAQHLVQVVEPAVKINPDGVLFGRAFGPAFGNGQDFVHFKTGQTAGNLTADAAIPDDRGGTALEGAAHGRTELFLGDALLSPGVVAGQGEHEKQTEFGHRFGIPGARAGYIGDVYPGLGGGRNIDRIQASAVLLDQLERRRGKG